MPVVQVSVLPPALLAGLLVEAVDHVGVGLPGVAQVVHREAESQTSEGGGWD